MRMAASRTTTRLSAMLLLAASIAPALIVPALAQTQPPAPAPAPSDGKVDTLKDVFTKLFGCWKPPPLSAADPMDITVILSFNRSGQILGKPRITYESATATDRDRLAYRVAVMEALQRCTPMPFTETMAGAVAGHPFAVQFRTRAPSQEKKAWLLPKIL
jgi:hypothetical protein